ncbi:sugar O-acetyltransferase [Nocardioides alcanivorans]|uniref:sugar O-acetyltransferase n=1 Tax=Nocardioides alcanivorans TaxID=2897352 RepID=UPI001F48BEC3|nr:sugar O-acetyltransferase [Nocardioides alcanivorans]
MGEERSARERMLAGESYRADDPELIGMAKRAAHLLADHNTPGTARELRGELLRELLAHVGADVSIRPPLHVDYGTHLSIGDRVFVNFGLTALDCATITIGDDTQIGPQVQLLTATHPLDPDERRAGWESAAPITIGRNVWIGGGAIVLGGVTVGDDAVVGAGAVVTDDVPARTLVVGTPARAVKQL